MTIATILVLVGLLLPVGPTWGGPKPADPVADHTWQIDYVDSAKCFSNTGPRSLALDSDGYPHIAYGGDHLYYAQYDGTAWQVETVDRSGGVGQYTSLALDLLGAPHISYYDATNGDLKWARYSGSGWQIETVDSPGNVGRYSSLALDSSGQPHISYCLKGPGTADYCDDLKYARYDGTAWWVETVDSVGWVGAYTALDLDSAGRPHIAYLDWGQNDLKYAHYDGTDWIVETVESAGNPGRHSSLALDSSDRPHISYQGDALHHVWYDGLSWHVETVDVTGGSGSTSLALDQADRPHISYFDSTHFDLAYAYHDGTAWVTETVDSAGGAGQYTSLALEDSGRPHISYFGGWADQTLRHAVHDGSSWQIELVDRGADAGRQTSLELDGMGYPHIAYQSRVAENLYELQYARWDGTVWQVEVVDRSTTGVFPSLELDIWGRPHISYEGRTSGPIALCYAYYGGTVWITQTVDSIGWLGSATSLALGGDNRPHITYFDADGQELRYAYYTGTTWVSETVDSAGSAGRYSSLALDGLGRPHVSYLDTTRGTLKYAYDDGTAWITQTVDSVGGGCSATSLALDALGRPHIGYKNASDLMYAWHDGTAWHTETVASSVGNTYESSAALALDSSGRPHIAYDAFDYSSGDPYNLMYAYQDGTSWYTETVDIAGGVGYYASLALDSSDRPHVSYYVATFQSLKYAWGTLLPAPTPTDTPTTATSTPPASAPAYSAYLPLAPRQHPSPVVPTPTPTSFPTPTATPSPAHTATPTHTPTPAGSATPTSTPSPTPTPTATPTPTSSPTPTFTATPSATPTPTPEPQLFATALLLDGVDDYASAPDSPSLDLGVGSTDDFTVEAFFYVPDLGNETTDTLIWKNGAYGLYILFSTSTADRLVFRIWTGPSTWLYLTYDVELAAGWHHIAAVFDNERTTDEDWMALYLDGSRVGSAGGFDLAGVPDSSSALNVGAYAGVNPAVGWIEEVRLSAVVRYEGTVYAVPTVPFVGDSSTRALWHFDEPSGSTLFADDSGNGNMLTGLNGAQTGNP